MCGIVGYIGAREAAPILLDGLKRLEYRGYDSAGIGVLNEGGFSLYRSAGKLSELTHKIGKKMPHGLMGIGHTRWATHGRPSEVNSHPHCVGRVAVVHNGIIENYLSLKASLPNQGRAVLSETDTEIIAHLINNALKGGLNFLQAFRETLHKLEGSYAIVVADLEDAGHLYLAKKGSPLVVGLGTGEQFMASDIPALLPYTRKVIFLESGEMAVCSAKRFDFYDKNLRHIQKEVRQIQWTTEMAEKGGYKHFMLKEIYEQPEAVRSTLSGRLFKGCGEINFQGIDRLIPGRRHPSFNRFYMVACGTSWHAAEAGKYFMEAMAKIPVSVDTASEFRYREPFIDSQTLLVAISQSGETADTLACVQEARARGARVVSICNVVDSSIPRSSNLSLYTHAGPEIGVASTKAFTTQLGVLLMLSLYLGRRFGSLKAGYLRKAIKQLLSLPALMDRVLSRKSELLKIAERYYLARDFYFIARGVHHPIALEGALKLKEISYIHAEGYSAGEMKHGPIALVEPGTPVVALAPQDRVCVKMISNIEEVRARGASVLVVATEGDDRFKKNCDSVFYVPPSDWYITPILVTLPLQLLAYYIADLKGTDVDQPRNLAKSVTVE